MGFAQVATRLVQNQLQPGVVQSSNNVNPLAELDKAGFSKPEVLRELRNLVDDDETKGELKYQILKTAAQMHGMLQPEEQARAAPIIQLTIVGDNARVSAMLCPKVEVEVEVEVEVNGD